MSFVPLMFSDWWEDLNEPHQIPAQNFAVGVNPGQLETPRAPAASHFYDHPWQLLFRNFNRPRRGPVTNVQGEQGSSVVKPDKDKFHVTLDIQQFEPDEIKVKVINNYVLVEGKHDEKPDEHGSITRHFIRKYLVPEQCDIEKVTSSLSSDGVLTLNAPRKDRPTPAEREIKIERTGKPAMVAEKKPSEDKEKLESRKIEDDIEEESRKKGMETERTGKPATVAEKKPTEDTENLGSMKNGDDIEEESRKKEIETERTGKPAKVAEKKPAEDTEKLGSRKIEDNVEEESQKKGVKTERTEMPAKVAEKKTPAEETEKLESMMKTGDKIGEESQKKMTSTERTEKPSTISEKKPAEETEKLESMKIGEKTGEESQKKVIKTESTGRPAEKIPAEETEKLGSTKIGGKIEEESQKRVKDEVPKRDDVKSKIAAV